MPLLLPSRLLRIRCFNEAFNVGQTAHNYRIRDLADIVAKVVPGCTIEFADDAGPDKRSYRVSFEKISRKLPAFRPQWDARMGAEQLYNAYRRFWLTLADFEGPRYQRLDISRCYWRTTYSIATCASIGLCVVTTGQYLQRRCPRQVKVGLRARYGDPTELRRTVHAEDIGDSIFALAAKLYPICRSITGDGVRQSLREIGKFIKLDVHEVPTGTAVFDWTIPREWNIRDAYIKNERGEKIVDFSQSNLHVVSYSVPVRQFCTLPELKKHLHTLPQQPDLIPYRTSYYTENWGFCITHRQFEQPSRRNLRSVYRLEP